MQRQDIINLVKSVVETEGYVCWGVEFNVHGKRALLRVFIDHSVGVTLDACSEVSGQLSAILDIEECIKQPYTLEVSSPGIERPIFTPEQYEEYVGSKLRVRCFSDIDGRKNFMGILVSGDQETVKLRLNDGSVDIPITNIRKARLVVDEINPKHN